MHLLRKWQWEVETGTGTESQETPYCGSQLSDGTPQDLHNKAILLIRANALKLIKTQICYVVL